MWLSICALVVRCVNIEGVTTVDLKKPQMLRNFFQEVCIEDNCHRGQNNYQSHGSRFLVRLWYRVPQIDLKMILVIMQDPAVLSFILAQLVLISVTGI